MKFPPHHLEITLIFNRYSSKKRDLLLLNIYALTHAIVNQKPMFHISCRKQTFRFMLDVSSKVASRNPTLANLSRREFIERSSEAQRIHRQLGNCSGTKAILEARMWSDLQWNYQVRSQVNCRCSKFRFQKGHIWLA